MRELGHDRDEREQRDPGREHRQTEFRVAVQLPRLGSDITTQAVLSLRLRPGDDACVSSTFCHTDASARWRGGWTISPVRGGCGGGTRVAVKRYKF